MLRQIFIFLPLPLARRAQQTRFSAWKLEDMGLPRSTTPHLDRKFP
jgi:hypothetical protein